MRIRLVDIDDGPRLWDLRLEMLADAPLAYQDTLDAALARGMQDYVSRVGAWITDPTRAQFVAEDAGRLVGHVAAFADSGYTAVIMVYVTPQWRGRGVLPELVDAVAAWSRASGRPGLLLSVMARNVRAIRAYRRLGFNETGLRYQHPHMPVFTEVEMTRPA